MPQNFIPCDRDQQMLMPPDMRLWLPPDHLCWFVIDSLAQLELSDFYGRHRDDGWGRAAFDPRMMVTLLLYAYAVGVRSAREIERRCVEDVAFRVIAANERPDHATICRFRGRHREALSELLVGVLGLCGQAGMIRPGVVAIDGTKMAANASSTNNLTREQLEDYARRVFDEAEEVDAAEDELYGDRRGDEMPENLRDSAERIEWIRSKLAEREIEMAARKPDKRRSPRVNTTDPDSATQRTAQGYLQGYNAQAAVSEDHFIVAADLTADNNDVDQLEPLVAQAQANLDAAPIAHEMTTVVADNGYFSEDNMDLELGVELLLAPVSTRRLADAIARREPLVPVDQAAARRWRAAYRAAQHRAARRHEIVAAQAAGLITRREAGQVLQVPPEYLNHLKWKIDTTGRLPKTLLPKGPTVPSGKDVMLERFAQPRALDTYGLRMTTVEPVFGQIKELRGVRRFLHRGIAACSCEWRMVATAHNLRRMWAMTRALRSLAFRSTEPALAA